MKLFEFFYYFWKLLSFGMDGMHHRALGSITMLLYFIIIGALELIFLTVSNELQFVILTILLIFYFMMSSVFDGKKDYLAALDKCVKKKGFVSVLIVGSLSIASISFFIYAKSK